MARLVRKLFRGISRGFTKIGRLGKKIVTKVGRIGGNIVKKHGATLGAVVGSFTPVGTVGGRLIGGAVQKLANTFS